MKRRTTARAIPSAVPWILIAFVLSVAGLQAQSATKAAQPTTAKPVLKATPAPIPALAVRMKFQDFIKDKNRLDAFVRAIGTMKSRSTTPPISADYRRSWEYWSAMHGFYGPKAKAGLIQDAIDDAPANKKQFYKGLRDLTYPPTPAGLAAKVWDQCQHGTLQFLTWHRIYLYYFESVLQQSANDKTLRLPYWDYTDPTQVQLPAQFAQPTLSDGKPNPLFDPRRRSQTVKLDPNTTNVDNLLKKASFNSFSPELEQQPHGTVHCTVGPDCPYPLMGDVPVAGTDPIFWLHHANIDRVFECWLKLGGSVPANLKGISYSFVDASGNLVKLKYSDLPTNYTYDHVTNCGRKPIPPFKVRAEGLERVTPLAKLQGFQIGGVKAAARLAVSKSNSKPTPQSLVPSRTELVLDKIAPEGAPGVLFNVFLETTEAIPRRQYVATISFFGLKHHAGKGGISTFNRNVDVSDALQALKGPNGEVPEVKVVFEATDGTAGAKPEGVLAKPLKVGTIQLQEVKEQ
ncbi:MAG: tyrosinase family protein [Acidobacteria bacterium]|nr:tyrosinase family protein [Acidobacteriota bacterium]